MRPFCETSSSAKTLTKDKLIGRAIRSTRIPMIHGYEVRKYNSDGSYNLLMFFVSKQSAKVYKSFYEIEHDERLAIVAVSPNFSMLEKKYFEADAEAVRDLVYSRFDDYSEGGD